MPRKGHHSRHSLCTFWGLLHFGEHTPTSSLCTGRVSRNCTHRRPAAPHHVRGAANLLSAVDAATPDSHNTEFVCRAACEAGEWRGALMTDAPRGTSKIMYDT
ncbi:hypothetical protein Y032_0071g531 [Ancylostoma ceylanicum]|uniref:Uncharacterized protein n=1 Tax=Ancylostoma ceylanicum TaxID=53326 RepID=A0A016TWM6_9BILA|nr:hypothetical protein Y032_0071g531 [Ancylostoma ceylanicum]